MFKGLNNILVSNRILCLSILSLILTNFFGFSSAKNGANFEIRRILSPYKYNTSSAIKYTPEEDSIDLRKYIKAALNLEQNNNTLDSVMTTAFNVDNPNPMYVFVLPVGLQNRTLVLRRSDFDDAIFPNISKLQRQIMNSNISRLYKLIENLDKPTWMSEQPHTTTEFLLTIDDAHNSDLDEAESMKVVEENVRTERNFYKFMQYLNQHHETDNDKAVSDQKYVGHTDLLRSGSAVVGRYTKYKPSQSQIEYSLHIDYTTAKPIGDKHLQAVSWKDLGLDGWVGGIKEPGKGFDNIMGNKPTERYKSKTRDQTTQRYRSSSYISHSLPESQQTTYKSIKHSTPYSLLSIKNNNKKYYTPYAYEIPKIYETLDSHHYVPSITKKYVESTTVPMYQQDSWEVPMQISNELSDLLKSEDLQFHNNTGELRNTKPMWPVTSSRASHKDEDVFIARANNPFGHSTKWKWSNSSSTAIDTKENRSKRGALILYSMVKCSTGCDPLIYKGYGCYCGFLGSGRTLDGIDRCCKRHDYCYEKAKCPMFLEYFVPYLWKCYRGRALCAIDHGEWGGPGSCAARLCECDQTLSKCLRRFYCPRKRAVCSSSPWRLLQNVLMV